LFEPHIDKKLKGFAKEEDTQLSWKFETIPRSKDFPLGVRSMYRAYASDKVYEIIIPDKTNAVKDIVPYTVAETVCRWQPTVLGQEDLGITHDGMCVFLSIPLGPIVPAQFQAGHYDDYKSCEQKISSKRYCGSGSEDGTLTISEWNRFKEYYPQTDRVEEYLQATSNRRLYLSLFDQLFRHCKIMEGFSSIGSPNFTSYAHQQQEQQEEDGNTNNPQNNNSSNYPVDDSSANNNRRRADPVTAAIDRIRPFIQVPLPSVVGLNSSKGIYMPPRQLLPAGMSLTNFENY
jgi:hypothetical protein